MDYNGATLMAQSKLILYRGTLVIENQPKKIEAAQHLLGYTARGGRFFLRIPYGREADDWGADKKPCHDCCVIKGELHVPGCDAEECPTCGGQLLSCGCPFEVD